MNMFRSILIFAFGVYIGQEYGTTIPNIKMRTYEMFDQFSKSELYKKIHEDFKGK